MNLLEDKAPSHVVSEELTHGGGGTWTVGQLELGQVVQPGQSVQAAAADLRTACKHTNSALLEREREGERERGREGERDVLFNDALNTFYLRLYRVRHTV